MELLKVLFPGSYNKISAIFMKTEPKARVSCDLFEKYYVKNI
jgi:hypothetical protein